MEMSDSLHVPVVPLGDGVQRYVWDMPHGQVLIDVHPDGRVLVNGNTVADTVPQVIEAMPPAAGR